MTSNTRREIGR